MKHKIILGLTILVLQTSFSQSPQPMVVKIDGLRSAVGQVMVFVYNNEDDFPTKRDRAFKSTMVPANALSLVVSFQDVPNGTYGAAVYHDENSNGKMDRNWYGTPKEGYGASNDATGTFGPPKFKDAKFDFKNSQDTVKIIIHY
jgi:uncharacterized protein (DUF2141 family)